MLINPYMNRVTIYFISLAIVCLSCGCDANSSPQDICAKVKPPSLRISPNLIPINISIDLNGKFNISPKSSLKFLTPIAEFTLSLPSVDISKDMYPGKRMLIVQVDEHVSVYEMDAGKKFHTSIVSDRSLFNKVDIDREFSCDKESTTVRITSSQITPSSSPIPTTSIPPSSPTLQPTSSPNPPVSPKSTPVPPPFYRATDATVVGEPGSKNIRNGPGTEYSTVTVVYPGDRLSVLGKTYNQDDFLWYKVYVPNSREEGWIASQLLNLDSQTPDPEPSQISAEANATIVGETGSKYVRTGPGTDYQVRHIAYPGDRIRIVGSGTDKGGYLWYQVCFPESGAEGWIAAQLIIRDKSY